MASDNNTASFTLIEDQPPNLFPQGKDDTVYFDFSQAFTEVFNQGKDAIELEENKDFTGVRMGVIHLTGSAGNITFVY